jgi:predicted ABC-type ATPase
VEAGGHDVPAEVVRRRWRSGLRSFFEVYLDLVDGWTLTDNSDKSAVLVADGGRGRATAVHDPERFAALRRLSRV